MGWVDRRNWWKIGFFVLLFTFEITRESLVVESNSPQQVGSFFSMYQVDGYAAATGRWRRTDGGSEMVPGLVKIECVRDRGTCTETTVQTFDKMLMEPDISTFEAQFSPGLISYQNDAPLCARYTVRMDFELDQVRAVRERKPEPVEDPCQNLEKRIEMRLGDGYESEDTTRQFDKLKDEHFLPVMSAFSWFARQVD